MSSNLADSVLLPDPNGPYSVAMRVHALTDMNRTDPYAPGDAETHRQIVISVLWPIDETTSCTPEVVSYMPHATAAAYGQYAASMGLPDGIFDALRLTFWRVKRVERRKSHAQESKYPLALFSPGSGVSLLAYTAIARALASRGYVVVTVDHPYDANIVEFPDGKVILRTDSSLGDVQTHEQATRVG